MIPHYSEHAGETVGVVPNPFHHASPPALHLVPATPPTAGPSNAGQGQGQDQGAAASTAAATAAERVQRVTTSTSVEAARARAALWKAMVPPPKGKLLRHLQQKEVDQRVAESKSMQELLATRTTKEEVQIDLLEQRKAQEKALHDQRMSHEEELHMAKLVDMGVDIDDLRRRPPGFDAATQTETE